MLNSITGVYYPTPILTTEERAKLIANLNPLRIPAKPASGGSTTEMVLAELSEVKPLDWMKLLAVVGVILGAWNVYQGFKRG